MRSIAYEKWNRSTSSFLRPMSPNDALILEYTAVSLNIGYAYLLGRQVRVGWLLGFVASAIGVGLYAVQNAWIMGGIKVFYDVMGVYGWWKWGRHRPRAHWRWGRQSRG